jgi:SAM-dependent methyltransferase
MTVRRGGHLTVARGKVPGGEHMTSRFFGAYDDGTPPWDIGRAQGAYVRLAARGGIVSPVLDSGCGTGENALFLASQGHEVVGVDLVPAAIEKAKAKAAERGATISFVVGDALALGEIGRTFRTIVDSGVFHVFDDEARARYVASLAGVLEPGGRYHMLVFSTLEPTEWGGPRRISEQEIRDAFREGWQIESIEPERFETNFAFHEQGGHALLATIRCALA